MKILVFSDARNAKAYFPEERQKKGGLSFEFRPRRDLKKTVKNATGRELLYLDVSGLEARARDGLIRMLSQACEAAFGILDPKRQISDVAALFHLGASDYAGGDVLKKGITRKRLLQVWEYAGTSDSEDQEIAAEAIVSGGPFISSGRDWREIRSGREYTFSLMFIELDGKEEMERKFGRKNLALALASFRSYLEGLVRPFQGRIWIWLGFGGVVLFPFDGGHCRAMLSGLRLLLFKSLYDIEGSPFPSSLSFRIALHVGNVQYVDGDTGHVVSDTLNSLFHLGQQFAKRGSAVMTAEVQRLLPPGLKELSEDAGSFEGRRIFRFRQPLHSGVLRNMG